LEKLFEQKKIISTYDSDFQMKLKISSIFNYMQDTAAANADELGLGYKDLMPLDLAWILSWVKLEIDEYPVYGQAVLLNTWPKCSYKLYSMRDFRIKSLDDKIMCRATTAWLPINIKTKRVTGIQHLPVPIPYNPDLIAVDEFPSKINSPETKKILFTKKFRYNDLDINHHVNNVKYVEMILDCLPLEHYKTHSIKSIAVTFLSESFYDDEIKVSINRTNELNNPDLIEGVNTKSLKTVFASQILWT
jgi:acyl-ACP thioesterase